MRKITTLLIIGIIISFISEINGQSRKKKNSFNQDYVGSIEVYQPEVKTNWDENSQSFIFEDVVSQNLDSILKEQIYESLIEWIVLNFESENNILEIKDKDLGRIVARGELKSKIFDFGQGTKSPKIKLLNPDLNFVRDFTYPFSIDIKIKDYRFKYSIKINSFNVRMYNMAGKEYGDIDSPFNNSHFNEYNTTHKDGFDYYTDVNNTVKNLIDILNKHLSEYDYEQEDW